MKLISGWIGVIIVLISLLIQLWIMLQKKNHYKIFVFVQLVLSISAIFWMIYAFLDQPIYWPTGINNVFVFIFNSLFVTINIIKWKKTKKD